MKLVREAGRGQDDDHGRPLQRAPAFLFDSARDARLFGAWLDEHFDDVKEAAEQTTRSGKLQDIEQYTASRILFCRFNYTTGDAAGQNLTGKATAAGCAWIMANYPGEIERFLLESNFATDKKSSQVNMLRTRGKRVVAEATIPGALFEQVMRSSSDRLYQARQVSNLGGFMSGVNNNGAHSANGITAMFIATGQDVANVAESSAAFVHAEVRENGDYYYSVTIPSLIVATYGGGTGLATQRECLELRRALARLGDRRRGVGQGARPARPQPPLGRQELADRGVRLARSLDLRHVPAVELDVAGRRERLLDVPPEADRDERVLAAPHEQRLVRHAAQALPETGVAVRLVEVDVAGDGVEGMAPPRGRVRA
jgi:hypothetical protein